MREARSIRGAGAANERSGVPGSVRRFGKRPPLLKNIRRFGKRSSLRKTSAAPEKRPPFRKNIRHSGKTSAVSENVRRSGNRPPLRKNIRRFGNRPPFRKTSAIPKKHPPFRKTSAAPKTVRRSGRDCPGCPFPGIGGSGDVWGTKICPARWERWAGQGSAKYERGTKGYSSWA